MPHRTRAVLTALIALGLASACGALPGGGNKESNRAGEIGVNSFLWRASLDTIEFMPIQSEDPFGGVIVTEWYANPEIPDERFKATIYILDTRLRADAVRVNLFRQVYDAGRSTWIDAVSDPNSATLLENKILTRAREIRIATLN